MDVGAAEINAVASWWRSTHGGDLRKLAIYDGPVMAIYAWWRSTHGIQVCASTCYRLSAANSFRFRIFHLIHLNGLLFNTFEWTLVRQK
jgi:hypothetical protein